MGAARVPPMMPAAAVMGWSRPQSGIESRGAGPAFMRAGSLFYGRKERHPAALLGSVRAPSPAGRLPPSKIAPCDFVRGQPNHRIHPAAQGTALGRFLICFRTVPKEDTCA